MKNTEKAFLWITDILENEGISYKISGGFAARVHGVNRELADIDIEMADEDILTITEKVKAYITYGPTRYKDDNWDIELMTLSYEGQDIDISGIGANIFNKESEVWEPLLSDLKNSELIEVYGKKVRIDTIKGLIAYKSKMGREVDVEDVQQLKLLSIPIIKKLSDQPSLLSEWIELAQQAGIADMEIFKKEASDSLSENSLISGNAYFLERDGKIIATSFIKETDYDTDISCTIFHIAVALELRGKGVGKQLLDQTFQEAKSQRKSIVLLFTTSASEFYEKCGMIELGTIPHMVEGESRHFFYKNL